MLGEVVMMQALAWACQTGASGWLCQAASVLETGQWRACHSWLCQKVLCRGRRQATSRCSRWLLLPACLELLVARGRFGIQLWCHRLVQQMGKELRVWLPGLRVRMARGHAGEGVLCQNLLYELVWLRLPIAREGAEGENRKG